MISTSLRAPGVLAACLLLFPAAAALADVWKWVDAFGTTRYVDTMKPVFTWVEDGKVFFSDTPDHEDAIAVQLVWHSKGSLADVDEASAGAEAEADFVEETPEERELRLEARRTHCQRVTEIHESYLNAPRMYKTNDEGEREYLSDREVRKAVREIAAARKEACSQTTAQTPP